MIQSQTNEIDNQQRYSLRPRRTKVVYANHSKTAALEPSTTESVPIPAKKRQRKTPRVVAATTPNKRARKKTAPPSSKTETKKQVKISLRSQSTSQLKQKAVESASCSQNEMIEPLPLAQSRRVGRKKKEHLADDNNNALKTATEGRAGQPTGRFEHEDQQQEFNILENRLGLPQALLKDLAMSLSGAELDQRALDAIELVSKQYFKQVAHDLRALAQHANRSIITTADIKLLFKRQNMLKDQVGIEMLSQQYLPRELLREVYSAPCACHIPNNTIDSMEELDDTNDSIISL